MKRGKRSAKIQATVDKLLNKVSEPKFTALNSDKINLVRGLNHYAVHAKQEHSKKWAIEWAKKNIPEIVEGLRKQKDWRFSNRGFILRMVENGFVLEDDQLERIKADLIQISEYVEPVVEEKKVVVKKKKVEEEEPNKALEEFDYAVDDVLMGREPRSITFGTNKKHHAEIAAQCDKILREMEEAPEYFAKDRIRPLKKFLNEVKERLGTISKAVKQQRVRKATPKKINPAKMVSKMRYKKKDEALGLESLRPEALIGAKQAIVYNTQYRFLMYFKAASDEGFMVSGSTLKNYDLEKSVFKKIRKPEDMVKAIKGSTLAAMRKYLDTVKGKEFACKGRFNENTMILKVSG